MAARKLVKSRAASPKKNANEPAFGLEVWLQNSKKMTGHPRHVITGATYGRPEGELYSRALMADLIKRFLTMR